jgi:hypothetical protein
MSNALIVGIAGGLFILSPLGCLIGQRLRAVSQDYSSNSAPFEPVIKKQSRAHRSRKLRAALRQHQSSVSAGD